MKPEPFEGFCAGQEISVVEAMQKIDENARGILFILDAEKKLVGSLSDGDIRRWLIQTGELKASVAGIMNRNLKFRYSGREEDALAYMEKQKIRALPVVDTDHHIIRIIFDSDEPEKFSPDRNEKLREVSVVIMAGGTGTRLYPYTKILPKPLIPIGDIPIMERIINKFVAFGVQNYYVTVNYKKGMIKSYFSELAPDYSVRYVEEEKPLGTAGSLRLIKQDFDRPVFVTNCDILIHADYANLYEYHRESGNAMTVVTALKNIVVPYGVLQSGEQGIVTSMEEKPRLSYFVNTGMYVLNPEVIPMIPEDTFFHMTDLADKLLKKGIQVGMYPISEDSFLDMGEFEEMKRMEEKLDLQDGGISWKTSC